MQTSILAGMSSQFTWIDWLVVFAVLALTTWLGVLKAGRQATIRDFFLGGRKLPWWAVSGSIVATEISALTFVSVPWVVFQPGGNLTYLQLGLFGSVIARVIVGFLLVPAYYEREVYSPYDYMGNRLGERVRSMTTALFVLGGVLGQSARIYLTGLVISVVMRDELAAIAGRFGGNELAWAIAIMALISIVWTLLGGMTTVIWTDVMLFGAFFAGAAVVVATVAWRLDGGLSQLFREGWAATTSGVPWAAWGAPATSGAWGKFTLFDLSTDPRATYTLWTAIIAATWGGVGAYGTDQLMAQRMFCCRGPADARKAIIGSAVSQIVTILVSLAGVGLFVFYQHHVPSDAAQALLADRADGDRIFPVFVVEVVPVGLKGLILAAIFAAAISSVMGILTALSQTVMSAFYHPLRARSLARRGIQSGQSVPFEELAERGGGDAEQRRSVLVGRLLVVFWGVVLSLLAYGAQFAAAKHKAVLDLGLSLAGYAGGALLAGFALAFMRLRIDGRGYLWSAPLSVLTIFSLAWHRDTSIEWYRDWSLVTCVGLGAILLAAWLWFNRSRSISGAAGAQRVCPLGVQTLLLIAGIVGVCWLNVCGHWGQGPPDRFGNATFKVLAWPWYVPIGSTVAFVWGYLLAGRRPAGVS